MEKKWAIIALITILLGFTTIKIFTVDIATINRDEPFYGWQSLAIYHNPEMTLSKEINYIYPFALVPFISSPLNALFEPIISIRIITLLFGLVGIFFTYLIGKKVFSKKAGSAAAFLLATSPCFFYFATKAMPDVPIMALGTVIIYLLLTLNKQRAALIPIIVFLMYVIKPYSLVVIPPIVLFLIIKYRKKTNLKLNIAIVLGTFLLILVGFNFYPAGELMDISNIKSIIFPIIKMRMYVYRIAGFAVSFLALFAAIKMHKKVTLETGLLISWLLLTAIPFIIMSTWNNDRYFLIGIPPLAIIAGQGLILLLESCKVRKKAIVTGATIVGLAACFFVTIPLWNYDFDHRYQTQYSDLLGNWIKENIGEDDTLIILSSEYTMRSKRLSAEKTLENPREQMIVNPAREEFEEMSKNNKKRLFLVINESGRGLWFYTDLNREKYVEEKGFEKETEIKPLDPIYIETYTIYKKPIAKN